MINIVIWLIFGALAGWVASIIMGAKDQQGVVANIGIGLIGALIGGWTMHTLGGRGESSFNLISFLFAVLGSILLLSVFRFLKRKTTTQ